MRVRYGKPIKAKSLLGQSNIPFSYTGPNVTFYPLTTGTFYNYAGPSTTNVKYVNRQANHKYFIYLNADVTYTWTYFGIWDTYNSGYDGNRTAPTKDGNNYYAVITPTTAASSGVPTLQFGNTNSSTANYALIIDLTEIGLDTLTAQQFYNKYNKYFSLIATGEEITIDDKAGQIAYNNLEEDSIRCKVAGGSSDIYYGYNNLIDIYSYNAEMTVSNITETKITLTTTSTGINRFSYNIPFISGHKYLLHEKITTGSTIPYTKIVCTTKNDSLQAEPTLWENVTPNTTKNVDLILTAAATQTDLMRVIYLSSGLTAGISFDVEDIYLLDLTDWFGIGKEPSTVQEFKEKFTKEYYGFCSTPIKLTRYQIEALPSYGYNQLIQFIQRNNYNGITWTPTTNGIYNLSGTSTNTYSSWGEQLVNEHKYMIYLNIIYNPNNVQMKVGLLNVSSGSTEYITSGNVYKIVKYNTGDGKSFGIVYPSSGTSLNNMQIQVMCIDLTDWYGAGSEPTTVEEFKATFPNKYYPYSKKRLLNKYMINKLIN